MLGEDEKRRHHHGNAREALIQAATELLETTGAANLSLRGIAERAGLSRQAPYNHFESKEALLAALVVAGFERLTEELREASSGRDEMALASAGEAYIAFAQAAPALFRMMFACELVDQTRFPDAAAAGAKAFAVLVEIVATIVPPDRQKDVNIAAWCIVHGYATLCIETGLEPPDCRAERARQFARFVTASVAI